MYKSISKEGNNALVFTGRRKIRCGLLTNLQHVCHLRLKMHVSLAKFKHCIISFFGEKNNHINSMSETSLKSNIKKSTFYILFEL